MTMWPNLEGCIAAERAGLGAKNDQLTKWRAEPANTSLVEQARGTSSYEQGARD